MSYQPAIYDINKKLSERVAKVGTSVGEPAMFVDAAVAYHPTEAQF